MRGMRSGRGMAVAISILTKPVLEMAHEIIHWLPFLKTSEEEMKLLSADI